MLRFLALLIFGVAPVMAVAEERPAGLLWHRSGLAATIPLQVKTTAETDYLLRLRDLETGDVVLGAYVRGGEFFRVLVPPGWYALLFSFGETWQGEADLFGPDTQQFALDPPLRFRATSTRKEGHLIDLRDLSDITVRDMATCQRLQLDPDSLRGPRTDPERVFRDRGGLPIPSEPIPAPRYETWSRVCF